MHYTIFDTPIAKTVLRRLCWLFLKLMGWRWVGKAPDCPKYIIIAAPHSTNWDFPIMLSIFCMLDDKAYWLGKHTLFRWPFGMLFRWLGGIPVERSSAHGVVEQTVQAFNRHEKLVIAIPPEGTRKKVAKWKTGFYHIACKAKVPIVLGHVDYPTKVGGFGPLFTPTGDLDTDLKEIKQFYEDKRGKYWRSEVEQSTEG